MELREHEKKNVRDHLENNKQFILRKDGKGNIERKMKRRSKWEVMELHEIHALANSIF